MYIHTHIYIDTHTNRDTQICVYKFPKGQTKDGILFSKYWITGTTLRPFRDPVLLSTFLASKEVF